MTGTTVQSLTHPSVHWHPWPVDSSCGYQGGRCLCRPT